jgi:nitrate reductase gamma subunit
MKLNPLFGLWPYVSLGLLGSGIVARYILQRSQPNVERSDMARARATFGGGAVWRSSLLLLAAGHVIGIALPRSVLLWSNSPFRLYLMEAAGFAVAVAALVAGLALLRNHLKTQNRPLLSDLCDSVFLTVLLVGVITGLIVAAAYRWGAYWGAMILAPYTASLLHGQPASDLVMQMPLLVRVHVFSMFAALAVFPVTSLSTFVVVGLRHTVSFFGRRSTAAGNSAEAWLRKHNPGSWLWPEED